MPVGYRNSAGVDFDDLFDPDVQGDGPTAPFLRTAAGVAVRYADISYGSKGPNVGYRTSAGVDVSNLWAAKGTATYVTDGGVPPAIDGLAYAPAGESGSASASLTYKPDRTVAWEATGSPSGQGTWLTLGSASDYDVRFDVTAGPEGNFSGTTGQWLSLSTERGVSVLAFLGPGGTGIQSSVGLRLRLRHRASGVVHVDRGLSLLAEVTR